MVGSLGTMIWLACYGIVHFIGNVLTGKFGKDEWIALGIVLCFIGGLAMIGTLVNWACERIKKF